MSKAKHNTCGFLVIKKPLAFIVIVGSLVLNALEAIILAYNYHIVGFCKREDTRETKSD
jgi:hypothetical protein